METDLYGNRTWITEEEYKQELKEKREKIKSAPEYYGTGAPSKKRDYINYKNFLKSKVKKMNKQEKIDYIYEKIARKDLSFGCFMKDKNNKKIVKYVGVEVYGLDNKYDSIWDGYRIEKKLSRKMNDLENYEIIGHPVMIGDVIDYIHENNIKLNNYDTFNYFGISKSAMYIFEQLWQKLKAPIEDQSDECVDFVYDLIS